MMRLLSAAALCVLACPAALRAQGTTALAIRVVDPANAPVARARLELVGTRFSGVSDDSGWVRLQGLPAGPALLRVTRIGYAPLETTVALPAGAPFEADVELAPTAVPVRGVAGRAATQTPGLATTGFYRRKEIGFGAFLTEDDIVRSRATRTSDLFRRIAGVRVVPAPRNGHRLQTIRYGASLSQTKGAFTTPTSRNGDSGQVDRVCFMTTIIDGVQVPLADIDEVRLESIGAVEVYRGPSEIPPEFNQTGSVCGVVVMWTRMASAPQASAAAQPAAPSPTP